MKETITKPTLLLNAENHTNQGLQTYSDSNWKSAKKSFSYALLLYQAMDDQQGVLTSHINLAEVALSVNDYLVAKRHLKQAEKISAQAPLQNHQPRITLLYASVALQQQQITKAEAILQPLLPEFKDINPVTAPDDIQTIAIINRTKIAFAQNQDESLWTSRYAETLKLLAYKNTDWEAHLLRFQSKLLIAQGAYKISESNLQQALSSYKKNLSLSGIAATLLDLAQLHEMQSDWVTAADYLNRSIAVFNYLGNTEKVNRLMSKLDRVKAKKPVRLKNEGFSLINGK